MSDELVTLPWIERFDDCATAYPPFGSYTVDRTAYLGWQWSYCFEEYYNEDSAPCADMAEGKAFAEAHWRERVRRITTPLTNRITALEAENAAFRAGLASIASNTCCTTCQEAALVAKATLRKEATK